MENDKHAAKLLAQYEKSESSMPKKGGEEGGDD